MALKKPNRSVLEGTADAKDALLDVLLGFYDAIRELLGIRSPNTVPALKAITVASHAALRQQVGDYTGEAGPRAAIVIGRSLPLDGGQVIVVWDANSTALDDGATVFQPLSLGGKRGRWRKGSF